MGTYPKGPTNDLRGSKSHRKHKLQNNLGKILNLLKYLLDDL